MTVEISKQTARRFLLFKQMLLPPRQKKGLRGIEKVFKTLRVVQQDPLNPCGRNADLVLQARVAGTHPEDYYRWLYGKRKGIEYCDKELCIVPVEDLPLCSAWYERGDGTRTEKFVSKHRAELEALIKRIEKIGPLCSLDLLDKRRDNVWWNEAHWGKNAVESLWRMGELVIENRKGSRKYYQSPRIVYDKKIAFPTARTMKLKIGERILRRVRAVGMLPKNGGVGWVNIDRRFYTSARGIAAEITRLVTARKLIEVRVEGISRPFVIAAKDKAFLARAERAPIRNPRVSFIAPLDNLIWDRQMTEDLFGFRYRWEVYTPKNLRAHGYYVLPILYGDRFVGRIEPVLADGILRIRGLWFEKEFRPNAAFKKEFRGALEKFREYARAKSVVWECAK